MKCVCLNRRLEGLYYNHHTSSVPHKVALLMFYVDLKVPHVESC